MLTITEPNTRDDLAEAMAHLNGEAKALSRRGACGTGTERYAVLHLNINVVLTQMQLADD